MNKSKQRDNNSHKNHKTSKTSHFIKNHSNSLTLILFVLFFASIGTWLYMSSRAAGTAVYSLSPSSSSPILGTNITINIQENSGVDAVNAVQADLTYDQAKLQFISIDTTTGAFNGMVVKSTGGNGVVNIAAATSTQVTGLQTVATVTFKTIGVSTTAVNFANTSAIVRASDSTNVLGTMTGGNYTIMDKTKPIAPTGLGVTSSTASSITLGWTPSSDNVGVTGYNIYRNAIKVNTSVTNSFTDTDLSIGVSYTYTVAAYDAAGNISDPSNTASFTIADTSLPSVPSGFSLTSKTSSTITFSWSASTDNVGVTGYKIYRGGVFKSNSATTSYQDTGLLPNTSYTYTVAAYDAAGNTSAQSTGSSSSFITDYKNGDINGDGLVNITDLSILSTNYGKTGMTRAQGNLYTTNDTNSVVNVFDLSILASYWGT